MSSPPVRTVIVAITSASVVVMGMATFESASVAIRDTFGVSTQTLQIASAVPGAASMLLVFIAGMLSRRVSWFTLVRWAALLSAVALVITAAAPSLAVLTLGRGLSAMGGVVLVVAGLGILQKGFVEPKARARVFGLLAAIAPAVYLITPTIAGVVTDLISWRAVPVVLAIGMVVLGLLSIGLPPLPGSASDGDPGEHPEWLTPLLAGVALALLVGTLIAVPLSLVGAGVLGALCVVITALTIVLWRRSAAPGLDVSVLQQPAMTWIVIATSLTAVVSFVFFTAMWLQSQPGAATTTTALIMTIPQLVGIVGGFLGGRLASRFGPYPVAIIALSASVLGGISFIVMGAATPAWLVVATAAFLVGASVAASGPVTQIFLERVPDGREGSAAAWRTAIRTSATAVGSILVIIVAASVYRASVAGSLEQQGVDPATAAVVAAEVQGRVPIDVVTANYILPNHVEADLLKDNPLVRQAARADAMGVCGAFTIGTNVIAAGALVIAYRRRSTIPSI